MTKNMKQKIIIQVTNLLEQLIETDEASPQITVSCNNTVEMLTVKKCTEVFTGLSEHTIRQLVAQKKIPFIRTGQGKRGKILIPKSALLKYINNAA